MSKPCSSNLCGMSDNKVNDDMRRGVIEAAERTVGDLIYTVMFDFANEIITTQNADADMVLGIANVVVAKYADGVKIRKKPAPRAAKAPAKKQVDVLTAAGRKLNNLGREIVWMFHTDSSAYSYATNVYLATGHPVRDNMSKQIVYVVNEKETARLTDDDVRTAVAMGLPVSQEYFS